MKFNHSVSMGILAVISEDHATIWNTVNQNEDDPIEAGIRIFTFCSKKRMKEDPSARAMFTGTFEDLDYLIKMGGHILNQSPGSYIPFSNSLETGFYGEEAKKIELTYVTTPQDVLEAFGLVL